MKKENANAVNAKSVAKEQTMKTTIPKLRKVIRESLKEAYVPRQKLDFAGSPGYVDDYKYEEWKIIFPRRGSPVEKEWREWYQSLVPSFMNRFDPAAEQLRISYHDPEHRTRPHSAKIRVMAHNSGRFRARMPPQDTRGHAEIKLMKRV